MLKTSQSNDKVIWNKFRTGDREAFARIFELYYQSLYAYGRPFLADESLAEDAIQDLFITLWRTRENLSEVDNIKYYLFRCLRRNIRRLSERELRRPRDHQLENLDGVLLEPTPSFAEQQEESLYIRRLKFIIFQLPKRQREVVNLRYYENFETTEIASIMGISEKTVRNTLFNAIAALRANSDFLKTCLEIILASCFLA